MNPNTALGEIRRLVRRQRYQDLSKDDTNRLVKLIDTLDGWLSGGGAHPAHWLIYASSEEDEEWWWVRPGELAARCTFDAEKLRDMVNPEEVELRQLNLVMAAIGICEARTADMTIPEE